MASSLLSLAEASETFSLGAASCVDLVVPVILGSEAPLASLSPV
eukprot:CAMPEP_0119560888 /NCGR_PEP_ID=MMETSP1352-20130426/16131_1 /TAXON_ID=265584 /ORGANISM="Stauroneis constricta, Strain CCMP1120" /LENGTH=43 /DNA_ID= /DNA_START= /DNA_END= /DNA_ORIENTATION=